VLFSPVYAKPQRRSPAFSDPAPSAKPLFAAFILLAPNLSWILLGRRPRSSRGVRVLVLHSTSPFP